MSRDRVIRNAEDMRALAELLSRCPQVSKFDDSQNREAWTLAHAFADLEDSFRRLLERQFPKLAQSELSPSEINDLLLEIGEELRHILYHIKTSGFYGYLDDTRGEVVSHSQKRTAR